MEEERTRGGETEERSRRSEKRRKGWTAERRRRRNKKETVDNRSKERRESSEGQKTRLLHRADRLSSWTGDGVDRLGGFLLSYKATRCRPSCPAGVDFLILGTDCNALTDLLVVVFYIYESLKRTITCRPVIRPLSGRYGSDRCLLPTRVATRSKTFFWHSVKTSDKVQMDNVPLVDSPSAKCGTAQHSTAWKRAVCCRSGLVLVGVGLVEREFWLFVVAE
ncbi:hypothetical protein Q8A73_015495 [Channa argus]|nr:hypothetical protein Q8A73_015495 [Channa argus]